MPDAAAFLRLARVVTGALVPVAVLGGCLFESSCKWNGARHARGESFPAGDGCNTCTCGPGGRVSCTLMGCALDIRVEPSSEHDGAGLSDGDTVPDRVLDGGGEPSCERGGVRYGQGESFPAADGCNTCTCGPGGRVSCTAMGCALDAGAPPTCDAIAEQFSEELQAIQACSGDDECGQPLIGTSCGCTRDLVARKDADPAQLMELLAVDVDGRSCVELGSSCDCPETDGFACVGGRCAWRYTDPEHLDCQDTAPAELCVRGTPGTDGETLSEGDVLRIETLPAGCWSSGCTRIDVADCSVSGAGPFEVESQFCLGDTGVGEVLACPPDCGGGGVARCEAAAALTAGEHTVTLGDLSVTFTVPGTLPFGGLCDGSPFGSGPE